MSGPSSGDAPPSGYGTPPPVVPPNSGRAVVRRAPGGILLPWLVSLVVLALLAVGFATLLSRGARDPVPPAVLDARASVAHATAEGLRRGLDEATDDLVVMAEVLAERDERDWDELLAGLVDVHDRYQVTYVVGADREPRHVVGQARPRAEQLPDPVPTSPGLTAPAPARNLPVVLAYAPVRRDGQPPLLLVGRYDVTSFVPALQQTAPGTAYVADSDARVVGSTAGFLAFQELPGTVLREAARRAATGERSGALLGDDGVVSFAPVLGESPAGRLGLTVLASVDREELALPANDARRLALLLGTLTGLLSLLSLFWFYLFVVGPVRRVAREAERLAFGDRSVPLHVVRYDEIGLLTRSLERIRTLLQTSPRRR